MKAALRVWAADKFTRSSYNEKFKIKISINECSWEKKTFLMFRSLVMENLSHNKQKCFNNISHNSL